MIHSAQGIIYTQCFMHSNLHLLIIADNNNNSNNNNNLEMYALGKTGTNIDCADHYMSAIICTYV